ncbi:transposable element Tcb2 transposase [Trichonephila clavipes]|nr:transposable element Tcb2 transposase [Trichonephila clavipes]
MGRKLASHQDPSLLQCSNALVQPNECLLSECHRPQQGLTTHIRTFPSKPHKRPKMFHDCFVSISTISQRSHLTDSEAWRVVGRLEGSQTQAEVAQAIGVSQSEISRIWNRFLEIGSADRRPGQGRRRATTPNEDRYLVLTARRHRNINATVLQQHLRSATGTTV